MCILAFDLENWIQGQFKVTIMKPIYDFLLVCNGNYAPILHIYQVTATSENTIWHSRSQFQGQRSQVAKIAKRHNNSI